MKRKLMLLLVLLIGVVTVSEAQSWRKLKREADQALAAGELADAADKYEQAYRKKRRDELTFQAGEIYFTLRDYRKAVEAYRPVKDMNDKFPLVGLKFARSLKQDGQYERAIQEFEAFADKYTGDGRDILRDIVRVEVQGCRLGLEAPARANRDIELLLPGDGINTDKNEFAPFPVSDNELFFASTRGDRARIFSSRRDGSRWGSAEPPRNFPVIQSGHSGNGALSPDGSRFYFTVCSNTNEAWSDVKTRCELFMTKRIGAIWSQPERLPEYINLSGTTATHPAVVHQRGQEILYFASNRDGGRGGMDIWYATRDLGIDDLDFSFPVNLGPTINTLGDEITPFYDSEDQTLYFASNGHVSIGGFDIFRSIGDEMSWAQPENLGMPFNSSADDYFYALSPGRTGGFLVSNRVFAAQKTTTTHTDIFEFTIGGRRIMVKGNVYDRQTGDPLNNITVALYQLADDGRETQLISRNFNDGSYTFEIMPNRRFRVEVAAFGFIPGSYRFAADDPNTFTYGQPIFLEAERPAEPAAPATTTPALPPTTQPTTEPAWPGTPTTAPPPAAAGAPYITRPRDPRDNAEYETTAPRLNGTYYKVQLAAVGTYIPERFDNVANLGRLDSERILARNLTRVLLADYFTIEQARSIMRQAQNAGYAGAYIVEYRDGERYGKVN
jgi:tetratricopeptide (TPR) repeat protein